MDTPIIRNGALVIEGRNYPSAAFSAMLNAFDATELAINSAAIEPDEDGGKNFTVTGTAQLLSQPVAVALYLDFLPSGGCEFQLTATLLSLSLATLHNRNILPRSPFVDLCLSTTYPNVTVIFDSEKKELYFGALDSDTHLPIVTGLSLDHLGFELLRSYTEQTIALNLYATIRIGNTAIETKIEIPLGGGLAPKCWVVKSRSTIPFGSGLTDIVHFLGSTIEVPFDNVFPEALNSISTFFLDDLQILLDPAAPRIEFLTFRLKSVRALEIGGLSISKVGLRANITPTRAAPEISLTLFGLIKIKEDVFLDVQVMLPENLRQDNWIFFMSGGVALNGWADIAHLPINTPVNDLHLHPGFLRLDSLELKMFEVDFNPIQPAVSKVVFALAVYAECELIHDFKLKNPSLSFTAMNPFNQKGMGNRSIIGSIAGTIAVGDINFGIEAEKQERGWSFTGTTAAQSIPIGTMLSSIGNKYRTTLPDFLNGMELENLTLRFATSADDEEKQSTRVTFDCQGAFPIHDRKAKLSLAVDVAYDGSYTIDLSGKLTISTLDFTTTYSKYASDNFFTAVYSPRKDQTSIKLKDVIGSVSSQVAEYVPKNLEVDLKYVVFAFDKDSRGNRFLFGMDLGASAKLSDLVSNLPLVGQMLPRDQTIGIDDLQILIASQAFDSTLGARLAGNLPAAQENDRGRTMLRKGLSKGIHVSATMRFGNLDRPLDLPIAASDPTPTPPSPDASANTPDVTSSDGVKWFALQKAFGPVYFNRVGVQCKDGELYILLDAAMTAAGLTLSLDGLAVSSPLNKFDPTFHLRGLGIDYRNGPLEIGGAFLKQTIQEGGDTYTSFAGLAVLRTQQLSLSAIGSYALKDGHPSLFIYAVLDYPLGGPSFFFVTGLAAGFGYNRALIMPTIEQVESFPLVQQATSAGSSGNPKDRRPPPPLPTDQKQQQKLLTDRLNALEGSIPRAVGEHFLAIGLRFTSFKTINSFALLTVKFGKELEFDLLGLSTLEMPEVAYAQLALKATFNPTAGLLEVRAQLAPNSYLLSHACHLTGGFAFSCWFKDQGPTGKTTIRGGDFVLTLGGYHPAYDPPAHYPRVPRLGFNWQVDPYLQLKGDAYCAMTPHALMAGCHLEATWHKDQLKAWFMAGADFLLSWQPYHYDAHLYVDVGASYTFDLFGSHTVTVEVGADLHLWGPELAGEATIHWYIISFTVGFGRRAPTGLTPITWEAFKTAFLPPPEQICGIAVQQGLLRQIQEGSEERWIVNPKDFVLVTNAVIPSTEAYQGSKKINVQATAPAVRPVGVEKLASTHTITITRDDGYAPAVHYTPVLKAVPAALWGAPHFTDDQKKDFLQPPDLHDPKTLIENTLAGFEIRPLDPEQPGQTAPFAPQFYETELIPDAFTWEDWTLPEADIQGTAAWNAATGSIDTSILGTRNSVLQALGFANIAAKPGDVGMPGPGNLRVLQVLGSANIAE